MHFVQTPPHQPKMLTSFQQVIIATLKELTEVKSLDALKLHSLIFRRTLKNSPLVAILSGTLSGNLTVVWTVLFHVMHTLQFSNLVILYALSWPSLASQHLHLLTIVLEMTFSCFMALTFSQ